MRIAFQKRLPVLACAVLLLPSLAACTARNETGAPPVEESVPQNGQPAQTEPREVQLTFNYLTITPKDAHGNVIQAMIADDLVYLPVRTVAELVGLEYRWDEVEGRVGLYGTVGGQPVAGETAREAELDSREISAFGNASLAEALSLAGENLTLIDTRVEPALLAALEAHFDAVYEAEGVYWQQIRAVIGSDDLLETNQNGGRYRLYLPVYILVQKTEASAPVWHRYHVGIVKEGEAWYITDYD